MKIINFKCLLVAFLMMLISCRKNDDIDSGDKLFYGKYLVKAGIDISTKDSFVTTYKYDNLGRIIEIGDSFGIYTYLDTIVKLKESGGYYSDYYLNSAGLAYKMVSYTYWPTSEIKDTSFIETYNYDTDGHLIDIYHFAGNIVYHSSYKWVNDNLTEEMDESPISDGAQQPYVIKFEFAYYDSINNISFGNYIFGKQSKNFIKQKISTTEKFWEKYSYTLDSKNRPIKQIKTNITYMPIYSHYGTSSYDSILSTWTVKYIY